MSRHLKQVRRQLYRNLWNSYRGWWQWHRLCKKYRIRDTAVVLMPSQNRNYNFNALLYLNQMLDVRGFRNALVLTLDDGAAKAAGLFSDRISAVVPFSRKQAEHLMQYYSLFEFDSRLVIASLEEPNGRNGLAVIGKRGTTLQEIFVLGVYKVFPYVPLPIPVYHGEDRAIKEFLNPVEEARE